MVQESGNSMRTACLSFQACTTNKVGQKSKARHILSSIKEKYGKKSKEKVLIVELNSWYYCIEQNCVFCHWGIVFSLCPLSAALFEVLGNVISSNGRETLFSW